MIEHKYQRRLRNGILCLLGVMTFGTIGFMVIEHWGLLDAFYMTIITISTVGFSEVHPLSGAGRIFVALLILSGMGVLAYAAGIIVTFIVEGELSDILRRARMEKDIRTLKEHYIVCGVDNVARHVIEDLVATQRPFVVADKSKELIARHLDLEKILFVEGDPTEDVVLLKAGIMNARGLFAILETDHDNLFLVLSARNLNPRLRIIARAVEKESIPKILKVGADNVVSPNIIGGLRIASEMTRPAVVSFLDIMLREKGPALRIEEVQVLRSCQICGVALSETFIKEKTGANVLAIKDAESGKYIYNPAPDFRLEEHDILIVLADTEQLKRLRELVGAA